MSVTSAPPGSFHDVVDYHAHHRPTDSCFVVGGKTVTWREFANITRAVAAALRGQGSSDLRRVAIRIDDPFTFLAASFAALRCGAAVVPIPGRFNAASVGRILQGCSCSLVVADAANRALLEPLCHGTSVLTLSPPDVVDMPRSASESEGERSRLRDPDADMTVMYSSGTTQQPKGVLHTHAARCSAARIHAHHYELSTRSRTMITAPIYTGRALSPIFSTVFAGGTSIIVHPYSSEALLDTVAAQQPSSFDLTPTQFTQLLDSGLARPELFASAKFVVCTGSRLHPDLRRALFELFPGKFIEIYGSTEAELIALHSRDMPAAKRDSVGMPATGVHAAILHEDVQAPDGAEGEIAVRTPAGLSGYVGESATDPWWTDAEGRRYFRTGDIGRLDADGYLWLVGRKKDMLITAGFNIYAIDIESVLLDHPDVADAAVVGLPHDILGEMAVAFVVLKNPEKSRNETASTLCRWANARLNKNQKIYEIRLVDSLPRNASGKVMKHALAASPSLA